MTEATEKRNLRLVLKVVLVCCALSYWSSANASGGEAPQKRDQISITKPLMPLDKESLNAGLAWLYAIPKEKRKGIKGPSIVKLLNKESKLTNEERKKLWIAVSRYVEKNQLNGKKLDLYAAKKLKDPTNFSMESTQLLQQNAKTNKFAKFKDSGYERNILREFAISIEPKLKYVRFLGSTQQTVPGTDAPGTLYKFDPPKFSPEVSLAPKSDQSTDFNFEILKNKRFAGTVDSLGFPEVVYLETKDSLKNPSSCTGTLLSKSWLLTADHCIFKVRNKDTFRTMTVSLHHTLQKDLQAPCKECRVNTRVAKFCRHEWNLQLHSPEEDRRPYDVALLQLKEPLLSEDQLKEHRSGNVKFAMLGGPGADEGWASLASFGMNHDDKQEGSNDSLDVGPIQINVSRHKNPPGLVSWDSLIEGTPETETRSCPGDSGAPFFSFDSPSSASSFPRGVNDEQRTLIGIVSKAKSLMVVKDKCSPFWYGGGPLIADLKDWICNVIPEAKTEIRGCENTPANNQTTHCFDSE